MSSERTALVTGGTRGLGLATTLALARRGGHVAATYLGDHDAAAALRALADVEGLSISTHATDTADPNAARALVAELASAHGGVDHLVANAGLLVEGRVGQVPDADWDRVVAVNPSGPFHLAQAVWPHMRGQRYGRVVAIGSVTAMTGNPAESAYGAAKAGLVGLVRSLARAGARHGITANCVVPGVFETAMTASMAEAAQESIRAMIPVGRRGDPAELAHVVACLLDELGSYVTGAVIPVDGGLGMGD